MEWITWEETIGESGIFFWERGKEREKLRREKTWKGNEDDRKRRLVG